MGIILCNHPISEDPIILCSHPIAEDPIILCNHPISGDPIIRCNHPISGDPIILCNHPISGDPIILCNHPISRDPIILCNHPISGDKKPGLFRTEWVGRGGARERGEGHGGCMHSHQCWMTWYHIISWPDNIPRCWASLLLTIRPFIHLVHSFICSLFCFPSTSHYRAQDW
jgi:hypothetical protein